MVTTRLVSVCSMTVFVPSLRNRNPRWTPTSAGPNAFDSVGSVASRLGTGTHPLPLLISRSSSPRPRPASDAGLFSNASMKYTRSPSTRIRKPKPMNWPSCRKELSASFVVT